MATKTNIWGIWKTSNQPTWQSEIIHGILFMLSFNSLVKL